MPDRILMTSAAILPVNPWMMLPFTVLLLAIALMPFVHRAWWEKYYPHVSLGLGFFVCAYYILRLSAT